MGSMPLSVYRRGFAAVAYLSRARPATYKQADAAPAPMVKATKVAMMMMTTRGGSGEGRVERRTKQRERRPEQGKLACLESVKRSVRWVMVLALWSGVRVLLAGVRHDDQSRRGESSELKLAAAFH